MWGEAILSGLLAKYKHLEDRYFTSGTEAVLRDIVQQQGEIIEYLRTTTATLAPKEPKLTVLWSNEDGLNTEIALQPLPKGPAVVELHPDEDARLLLQFEAEVGSETVHRVCEKYRDLWAEFEKRATSYHLAQHAVVSARAVGFAVMNDGEVPAIDIHVWLTFPDSVGVLTRDRFEELEEVNGPPKWPGETLKIIAARKRLHEKEGYAVQAQMMKAWNKSLLGRDYSHFTLSAEARAELIDVQEDLSRAEFWLSKVKHGGMYRANGGECLLYLTGTLEADAVITYMVIADNISKPVRGTLSLRADVEAPGYKEPG